LVHLVDTQFVANVERRDVWLGRLQAGSPPAIRFPRRATARPALSNILYARLEPHAASGRRAQVRRPRAIGMPPNSLAARIPDALSPHASGAQGTGPPCQYSSGVSAIPPPSMSAWATLSTTECHEPFVVALIVDPCSYTPLGEMRWRPPPLCRNPLSHITMNWLR